MVGLARRSVETLAQHVILGESPPLPEPPFLHLEAEGTSFADLQGPCQL